MSTFILFVGFYYQFSSSPVFLSLLLSPNNGGGRIHLIFLK